MRKLGWGTIALVCLASSAHAANNGTMESFIAYAQSNDQFKSLVAGAGRGFEAANAELEQRGQPRLYCQPEHMAITPDQYVSFLTNYAARTPASRALQSSFFSLVLLKALADVFPCK